MRYNKIGKGTCTSPDPDSSFSNLDYRCMGRLTIKEDCDDFVNDTMTGKVELKMMQYANLQMREFPFWVDRAHCYPCVSGLHAGLPQSSNKYLLADDFTDALFLKRMPW